MFEKPRLRTVSGRARPVLIKRLKQFTSHHTTHRVCSIVRLCSKEKQNPTRLEAPRRARRVARLGVVHPPPPPPPPPPRRAAASARRRRALWIFEHRLHALARAAKGRLQREARVVVEGGVSSVNDSGEGPADDARRLASRICANNESNNAVSLRTNSFVSTSALCSSYAPRVSARRARVASRSSSTRAAYWRYSASAAGDARR